MKRGGPMKRTPFKRTTQLSNSPEAKRAQRMRTPMLATKRKYDPAEAPTRAAVRNRSGGMCEVCGAAKATNFQHRLNAGQGGPWTASNGLAVCGQGNATGCHSVIHLNPTKAYANGWSVKSWDNPLTCPVLYRGEWVLLDDAGGFTPSLPFEEGAA